MSNVSNKRGFWLSLFSLLFLGLIPMLVYFGTRDTRDIEYCFDKDSNSIQFIAKGKNEIDSIELRFGNAMEISNAHEAECRIISFGQEYVTLRYLNHKGEPKVNIFEVTISRTTNSVFIYQFDLGGELIDFSSYP